MPHEVIMNLPASATEFLDVFIGYGRRYEQTDSKMDMAEMIATSSIPMPRIHVYGFSVAADPVSDMAARAAAVLQCQPEDICVNPQVGGLGKCKKRKHDSLDSLDSSTSADPDSVNQTAEAESVDVADSIGSAHIVRDVAPNKVMVCLSFILPRKVRYIV